MSKPGHNSGKGGPIAADRLKSFIERIEKMIAERDAINGDIKDIYSEAKGVGYDVATMRKIVALRAKDAADVAEQETLLEVYKHALGMLTSGTATVLRAPEVTEEELEERAGRIAGEVDRCMALVTSGNLPKIEDIKRLIGCSNGKAQKLRGMIATRLEQFSRLSAQTRENPKPEDGDDGITGSPGGPVAVRNEGGAHDRGHLDDSRRHQSSEDSTVESLAAGVAAQVDGGGDGVRPRGVLAPEPEVASVVPPVSAKPVCAEIAHTENEAPTTPSVGAVAAEPRVAPPFLGDDPGPTLDFLRGPSPANRRVV